MYIYHTVFPLGVLYLEKLTNGILGLCYDCMQLRIYKARPRLVQGCKAPMVYRLGLLVNLFRVRPTEQSLHALGVPPPGLKLANAPLALIKLHCHY